jgi:hypothetical protein
MLRSSLCIDSIKQIIKIASNKSGALINSAMVDVYWIIEKEQHGKNLAEYGGTLKCKI